MASAARPRWKPDPGGPNGQVVVLDLTQVNLGGKNGSVQVGPAQVGAAQERGWVEPGVEEGPGQVGSA